MAYRAMIQPPFSLQGVKLLVAEDWQRGMNRVLMSDGTWREISDGAYSDDDAGIMLPFEALDAIEEAIAVYRGNSSHAATESKVLREWLNTEKDRVDLFLARRAVDE